LCFLPQFGKHYNDPLVFSTVLFSPKFNISLKTLSPDPGVVVRLAPITKRYQGFSKPRMKPMDLVSTYYLNNIGGFYSIKLDGIAAFLHFDKIWIVSLKDGSSFTVNHPKEGFPMDFGNHHKPAYIEILYDALSDGLATCKLYFISYLPQKFDYAKSVSFWREKFQPFVVKNSLAKKDFPLLYFKEYVPLAKDNVLPTYIRSDGIVFHCPFDIATFYWKPFETYDLSLVNKEGKYFTSGVASGDFEVLPHEGSSFTTDGIYECFQSPDKSYYFLHLRRDKKTTTDLADFANKPTFGVDLRTRLVSFMDFSFKIPTHMVNLDKFLVNHRTNYLSLISNIDRLALDVKAYRLVIQGVLFKLKNLPKTTLGSGVFLATDLVDAIKATCHYDPLTIWNQLRLSKLIQEDTGPYRPMVVSYAGNYRTVVVFNQNREQGSV